MGKSDNEVYRIRMKYERANVTDVAGLNEAVEGYLSENKPSECELDIIAGIYDFVGENIERNEIYTRSAEEWRQLEHEYVVKSSFTLPDLVDNLLGRLERGRITREQLTAERRRYRPCKHRFCLNYFIPGRKDAVFCSRDCKKREKEARDEFEKTSKIYANGTYLPVRAYKSLRQAETESLYRKYERLFEQDTLMIVVADEELKDTEFAGIRDRSTEERKNREWQLDKEIKGGQMPVNYEGMGESPLNF